MVVQKKAERIDVVLPHIVQPGAWESLRYALRSLDENFQDIGTLWLVGDVPDWINRDKVRTIEKNIPYSSSARTRNFNFCNSTILATLEPDLSDEFLFTTDDAYIVKKSTASELRELVLVRENLAEYTIAMRKSGISEWQKMLWNTADKLGKYGFGIWNCETHTPKMIEKRKLAECFALFGYGDGNLIWQTAYFNMFLQGKKEAFLSESSGYKAGFYRATEDAEIEKKMDGKLFLNHDDNGLTSGLITYITSRFPNPSVFEKDPA